MRRVLLAAFAAALLGASALPCYAADSWDDVLAKSRGETVYWNAWGGDECTNAHIDWVGQQMLDHYGVPVRQVKLSDTWR